MPGNQIPIGGGKSISISDIGMGILATVFLAFLAALVFDREFRKDTFEFGESIMMDKRLQETSVQEGSDVCDTTDDPLRHGC